MGAQERHPARSAGRSGLWSADACTHTGRAARASGQGESAEADGRRVLRVAGSQGSGAQPRRPGRRPALEATASEALHTDCRSSTLLRIPMPDDLHLLWQRSVLPRESVRFHNLLFSRFPRIGDDEGAAHTLHGGIVRSLGRYWHVAVPAGRRRSGPSGTQHRRGSRFRRRWL
jgi:hypothetical protein